MVGSLVDICRNVVYNVERTKTGRPETMDVITLLIILLALVTIGLFVWCILISRNLDNILQPRTRRSNPAKETREETPEDEPLTVPT